MKLGTFVGKQFLTTTPEEIKYVTNEIQNGFKLSNTECKMTKIDSSSITTAFRIYTDKMDKNYRTGRGDLVHPCYIRVSLCSQNGYDEAVHGKSYTWAKDYQPAYDIHSYSVKIDIIGHERRKHSRYISHFVGIYNTTYNYGTELGELEISDAIRLTLEEMNHWTKDTKTKVEF